MLASFLSLQAVGNQLMSTSRPRALCRATDDPTPTPRVATGSRHGCPFVGRGVFSSRRRMKPSQPGSPIPIASDRGSEPTVTGSPATHDRAPGWSPATPDRVTVHSGRVTPVRRKTETLRQQRIALFRKPTSLRNADPPLERLGETVRRRPRIETLMRIRTRDAVTWGWCPGTVRPGRACGAASTSSPSARRWSPCRRSLLGATEEVFSVAMSPATMPIQDNARPDWAHDGQSEQ
jgi:hypothetical protein